MASPFPAFGRLSVQLAGDASAALVQFGGIARPTSLHLGSLVFVVCVQNVLQGFMDLMLPVRGPKRCWSGSAAGWFSSISQ